MWGWLGGLGAGQVHSEDSQGVTAANRRGGQTFGNFFHFSKFAMRQDIDDFFHSYNERFQERRLRLFFLNIAFNTAEYYNQGDPCFYVKLPNLQFEE